MLRESTAWFIMWPVIFNSKKGPPVARFHKDVTVFLRHKHTITMCHGQLNWLPNRRVLRNHPNSRQLMSCRKSV